MRRSAIFFSAMTLLGFAPTVLAHPGHISASGFTAGLLHPFSGLDHLLAIIAVGVWAAQRGGRALFAVPASFVVMMAVGAIIAAAGLSLPVVEPGIIASLVVFGLLIAFNTRLPVAAGMAIVGVFALFHGYAHAVEIPARANLAVFGSAMLLGTITLHIIGIGLARMSNIQIYKTALRVTGSLIALAGVVLSTVG